MLDAIAARPDLVLLALAGLAIVALILAANSVIMRRYRAANSMIIAMIREQAEASARMAAIGEMLSGRQADLTRAVNERLDAVSHRLGQTAIAAAASTADHLQKLNERLAVIDRAQDNIGALSSQVTSLRDVLANKQARGAFGQARMEAIIADALPKSAYAFQFTLRNGRRPDCAIFLPDGRPLIVDAKFPLEAATALREAQTEEARKAAAARLRAHVSGHIADIAERYLVPGETQDLALMFVPSEALYAELHDGFDDVVQKAYRARVVLVSPALLMLAIEVIRQIGKDAQMREAADAIRGEVGALLGDVARLRERVVKLERHFALANEDVRQILISAEKIDRRGGRIEAMEFEGEEGEAGEGGEPAASPIRVPVQQH